MRFFPAVGLIICFLYSFQALGQVFPGVVATDRNLYVAVPGVATTLTSQVAASTTTFSVASVANMQPFELLVVDNEIVLECAFSPGTLQISIGRNTCPGADGRGIGGTSPASHNAGARIQDLITGEHHNASRKEIEAVEAALGPNLANLPGSAGGPPVPVSKGGTGATTQAGALASILGVNPLPLNGLCMTSGPGPATCISPGASGTVLTSTGLNTMPSWQTGGGAGGVTSVFGRMGTVAAQAGDYSAALVTNAADTTQMYSNPAWITTLAWSKITGAPPFVANPMISPGDFIVGGTGGAPLRLAVPGTGTFCPNWAAGTVTWVTCPGSGTAGLTSVGITMPSAFQVSGSPLTSNGVIAITGAGNATQYINGLGQLATLPSAGVSSVFTRTGAVTAATGDYTTAQVTEMTNLYFTNARVYASLSATSPITFNSATGVIACPTCGTGAGGVTSVFGRTGAVVAVTGDYNATQVTNAENIMNKDVNGGYVGRDSTGSATVPGTWTGSLFASSDTTHTSLMMMIPGLGTNLALPIATGDWGLFLDSSNGNRLTRQDSTGNKVVVESNVAGAPYVQAFTSQTSVALTHNLNLANLTAFNINCFDATNALIQPSSVTATNVNTVTATFSVATSGSCTVTTGGTGAGGGGGNITGPATTTSLYVPQWSNTTGSALGAGLPVTQSNGANSLVETGAGGLIAASTTGNAATATALAATPAQCMAGQFATGVAASGNANCSSAPAPFGYNAYTGSAALAFGTFNAVLVTASGANPTPTVSTNPSSNGTPVWIGLCNDATARSWTLPASFQQIATPIDPSQCVYTAAVWNGTSYQGTGANSTPLLIQGPERAAPTTPATSLTSIWPDSTRHTWTTLSNGSANQHIMPRCAGSTDQCALGDLSDGTAAGIVAKFTGCSGTQYLGADGACHTSAGGGGGSISGATALGTTAIAANTCATTVTATATGVATTNAVVWTPNADISGVTGYGVASTDGLRIYVFPTANTVNLRVCNGTSASITPGAATLNWTVLPSTTIWSGSQALGTAAIAANTCAAVSTIATTGVLATDTIEFSSNADISGVTGYGVAPADGLKVYLYPTANNVNVRVCNGTPISITPGAATLNLRVAR